MKTRIGLAILTAVSFWVVFLGFRIKQAIQDFHDEPDGFWE